MSTFYIAWRCFVISNEKKTYINEQIRCKEALIIGPDGTKMGIKQINDARTIASYANLDLVLISPDSKPAVCKIMDYSKYKYEMVKRQKEARKKQRETKSELKEFRLSVKIDVGDLETKSKNARKHLLKNNKVKVTVRFKGREIVHKDLGRDVLLKFAESLNDVSQIEKDPTMDGRVMSIFLNPIKK